MAEVQEVMMRPEEFHADSPPADAGAPEVAGKAKTKTEPAEPLPTNRVAFEKQIKCLLAYGIGSVRGTKSVSIESVANAVDMNASTVSLCNPFFVRTQLISKVGREFMPSDAVLDMARAHEFNPDTAALRLAPVISKTWFAHALETRLRLAPTDVAEAVQILADKANVGKDSENQLLMLIEYLREAGLIKRENNHLSWVNQPPSPEASALEKTVTTNEVQVPPALPKRTTDKLALIQTLVDHLPEPKEGKECSVKELADWLRAAQANLWVVYKPSGDEIIEITVKKATDIK